MSWHASSPSKKPCSRGESRMVAMTTETWETMVTWKVMSITITNSRSHTTTTHYATSNSDRPVSNSREKPQLSVKNERKLAN